MMMQKLKRFDPDAYPTRLAATAVGVGLVVATAALWFSWTVKERSLQPRTRDRLR